MSEVTVVADNLGKRYRLGAAEVPYGTLRDSIADFAKAPWRRFMHLTDAGSGGEHFWALRGISFEISAGEVVGIIGANGAGKSTLLKLLSRITYPTEGRGTIRGRVGSLLEVGTGFHPELSGRENIYLNGAVLGMGRNEIEAKFDEIVAFSEVERFIDTPVKRYSSGMYVRLAFAVAAYLEPEVLMVDEVLSVGDAKFQAKCLGRMGELASGDGRTVLFVSHNLASVRAMCTRCLWIDNGRIRDDGDPDAIIGAYLSAVSGSRSEVFSSPAIRSMQVHMRSGEGLESDRFPMGDPFDLVLNVVPEGDQGTVNVHLLLYDQLGQKLSTICTPESGHGPFSLDKPTALRARFDGRLLPGSYRWLVRLRHVSQGNLLEVENAFEFNVTPTVLPDAPLAYPTGYGSIFFAPEIRQEPYEVEAR